MDTIGQDTSCVIRMVNLTGRTIRKQTDQDTGGVDTRLQGVEVEVGLRIVLRACHMGVSKGPGTGAAYQTTLKALPHSPSIYGSARAFLSFAHNFDQLGEIDSCLMCSVQHVLETRVPESRLIGYWTQDFIYQLLSLL